MENNIVGELIYKNDKTLKLDVFQYQGIRYIKLFNGRSLLLECLNMNQFEYYEVIK